MDLVLVLLVKVIVSRYVQLFNFILYFSCRTLGKAVVTLP